jgi:hypothetical protein
MVSKRVIAGVVLLGSLAAAPAFAADEQHRRSGDGQRGADRSADRGERQAAPRTAVPRARDESRSRDEERSRPEARPEARRDDNGRRDDGRRDNDARRGDNDRRDNDRRDNDRRDRDVRRYDGGDRRVYQRPDYYPRTYRGDRWSGPRRYIRPRIVTIVPYRPYVYRPSFGLGIFYGTGGAWSYDNTPQGYYDPTPGRIYGGVRIINASRDAQVFADGYYVGLVDDFDGVFQHMNLEAGEHHIEIQEQGLDPIAFDIVVQPGQTMTLRADLDNQ